MDNHIKIPWYRAKPKMTNSHTSGNDGLSTDLPFVPRFPRPKRNQRNRTRQRQRVKERVRVPSTATEPNPDRVPNRYPILDPRQLPDAKQDPGTNPYREPGMNPVPVPRPSPNPAPDTRRDPGATPGVNQKQPMPQRPFSPGVAMNIEDIFDIPSPIPPAGYEFKGYSQKQQEWGNTFIDNLELVSRVTAIESKRLYIFVRDYDYETGNLSMFNEAASKEFGGVAAVLLTTGVAAKMLGQLWGKRLSSVAGSTFGTIKLDDDYMQEHFDTKVY